MKRKRKKKKKKKKKKDSKGLFLSIFVCVCVFVVVCVQIVYSVEIVSKNRPVNKYYFSLSLKVGILMSSHFSELKLMPSGTGGGSHVEQRVTNIR